MLTQQTNQINNQTNIITVLLDEGDVLMFDQPVYSLDNITSPQTDSFNSISHNIHRQRSEEATSHDFKDFIMEHALPLIEPLGYTYDDLLEEEKEYAVRCFQLFARCARVKINRLLKLGGIGKKTNIGCGCIETYLFQMMFQEMEGAQFFHTDRKVNRHGIRYKVPCIGYRFIDHLPVLDLLNNHLFVSTLITLWTIIARTLIIVSHNPTTTSYTRTITACTLIHLQTITNQFNLKTTSQFSHKSFTNKILLQAKKR